MRIKNLKSVLKQAQKFGAARAVAYFMECLTMTKDEGHASPTMRRGDEEYELVVPPEADLLHEENLPRTKAWKVRAKLSVKTLAEVLTPKTAPKSFSGAIETAIWCAPDQIRQALKVASSRVLDANQWVRVRAARVETTEHQVVAAAKYAVVCESAVEASRKVYSLSRSRVERTRLSTARAVEKLNDLFTLLDSIDSIPQEDQSPMAQLFRAGARIEQRKLPGLVNEVTQARTALEAAEKVLANASAGLQALRCDASKASAVLQTVQTKLKVADANLEKARVLQSRAQWDAAHPNLPTFQVGRTGREGVLAATINLPAELAGQAQAAGTFRPTVDRLTKVRLTKVRA